MKKITPFIVALCLTVSSFAQNLGYGKPSPEEISMKRYAKDTTAMR